jgi:6-phosphogluconate dehydrogenase
MTARLLEARHELVVHDRNPEAVSASVARGARGAVSLGNLVSKFDAPRVVWLMVPAGEPTEGAIDELSGLLKSDDLIVDGGNSYYKDTLRRGRGARTRSRTSVCPLVRTS